MTDNLTSTAKIEKKNQLGLIGAISYIVGTIIGSGIFISPTAILKQTGSIGMITEIIY